MSNSAVSGPTLIDFPAGMIMPFAGSTTPAGWLECNGAEVDITAYPTLAAALGTTWNTAKNPLTGANYAAPAAGKFRVPDMRGAFLRGSTGGANNQNGVATALAEFQDQKTKKNGLSATSNQVTASLNAAPTFTGSAVTSLGESVQHSHSINSYKNGVDSGQHLIAATGSTINFSSSAGTNNNNQGHTHSVTAAGSNSAPGITASTPTITVANGDAETRPDAVGVRYLIKF